MYVSHLILVRIPSSLVLPVKNKWDGERGAGLLNRQNPLSVTKVIYQCSRMAP